ncbi:YerC/YecD family TrpR-related protein [Aquisalinus flavus]|uniref:TrpR like protein, YerC/YecD n=1 Tax=Aquisalinus flavus TaxID=1526572 RepID=A0A8J2Y7E0_9PROT|nr:YerC/YecD family TrpR-related protein [Aquisalinus flavus]MBD0427382.1 helix-turn-helix domain-containing protein [Aquisalinus flavus]UNE47186.1 helix-turn-helix domain-containing protein [Aquisalinus flavus]GGD00547.1 hypothetical protein GCM10011342_06970 [Aquisalinus flavus]
MTDEDKQTAIAELCEALLEIQTREEANAFLRDLCTPGELLAVSERWRIARMLDAGGKSYRDIARATHASTTTVARVARFLRDEPWRGYRIILDRMQKTSGKTDE